ncbi:MAG TPA: J domain-containing protein [Coleofasciculaceae cyanobacterium]
MQNGLDYYEILGVERDSSIGEIKKVYRSLARQYHPDLNPQNKAAEEKFKEIGKAYQVLSNPNSRVQYDQFGQDLNPGEFQEKQTGQLLNQRKYRENYDSGDYGSADAADLRPFTYFNSFIDQWLGLSFSRKKGNNPTAPTLSPRDRFRPGTTKSSYTLTSRTHERDTQARLTIPLSKAYGGGYERIRLSDGRLIEVNMPAAMVTDQRIYFKGLGSGGGDLYLKITVEPHPFWKLVGSDIHCQLPITPSEAVLGGAVEVPTLNGRVKMNLPPGVKSGQQLRLASLGYLDGNGRRGDMVVELQIVVPRNPSSHERKLYEQLRQSETFTPRTDSPVLEEV